MDSRQRLTVVKECAAILSGISVIQEIYWTVDLDEAMVNVRALLDEVLGEL